MRTFRMNSLLPVFAAVVLLVLCGNMMAAPVTRQQAQQKAQAFLQKEGKAINVSQLRRAPARDKSAGEEEVEPYYVFNVGNNDGFVFVAGDDLAPDILGYSTRGHFDIDEIPENMKAWLDGYAEQIEYLRKHPSARRAETTNRESVTPLLKKENKEEITWAQRNPYNSKCPLWKDIYNEWNGSDEERVVTGCVATAMAQIMKYWEHPKGYTTSIPEYEAEIYDYRTIVNEETHSSEVQKVVIDKHIIEELPPIAFDWENMLEHYEPDLPNYTNEQALAVANLMRYCAQSAKMNYSPGSNEGGSNYLNFFIFGYDNELKYRENFEIAEWENLIYNELKSGRPVFFGGNKKNKRAHAFVVDGYRNDGLFHINWGWGWTSADPSAATDSYYILTIADGIADENVSNESNPFRYKQFACVGIQPIDDYNSANYDFESGGIYYRVETKKVSAGGQADSRRRVGYWLPDDKPSPPEFTTEEIAIVTRGDEPYEGDITIPIEVNYNGKTFPVHRVEKYAFVNCMELSTITFEGKPEIDSKAFFNCPRLTDVYAYGSIPYDISEDAFDESIYQTATLHVPEGQIDKFKDKKGWQNFLYKIDAAGYADNGSSEEGENILFVDSEVENICLSNWDSDGNGVLTKNEAAAVTDIGDLFYGNQQLASFDELKYFTGLTTIPEYAFTGCTNLVSVSLPPSITHVGEGAFWQCNSLVSVHMNEGLTELGDGAFALCTTLSFADIPSTVTKIGTYAFQDCVSLTSCNLPSGLTDIPYAAFIRCSKLKTVLLESNITSIDDCAFYDCVSLSNIELSNTLTSIGYLTFCGCEQLSSIDFPTSLKTIKAGAFVRSGLTSINLPASLETIEDQAFAGCNNLTSLSISSNVSSIGSLVVGWCKNLTSLTVDSSNPYYRSSGNGIIDRTTNMLVQSCPATIIPSDIVGIGMLGFGTVPGVEEVVLPDNIKNIGKGAFEECPDLKRITIPANIESIDREAFLECSSLEKVTILNPTPITITDDVFHMLETWNEDKTESTTSEFTTATLYVPAGSKNSYRQAPGWKNFQNIVEMESVSQIIHFADAEVKRICVENWDANGDGELSEVEAAAVSDIGMDFKHSSITAFNELIYFTGLESIPNYAFAECPNLTSIVIPRGVNSLGDYHPFASCPVLQSIRVDVENTTYDSRDNCNGIIETATNILVKGTQGMTIPSSVTAIGPIAFSGYSGMTSITIPNGLKSIGRQAFWNCQSLQSIHIPSSVTSIDKEVFLNCLNLATITVDEANPIYDSRDNCNAIIETATNTLVEGCNGTVVPASVKNIGECAFGGRQFMESIHLPDNLLSIGANAFWLCHSMDKVIIPSSVQAIGEYAFEDCIEVTEVYSYINNPFGINDNVFGMNYDASGNPCENYFSTATLYVPSGCKGAYQQAAGWKNFQNIVEMGTEEPELVLTNLSVEGDYIIGTAHTVSFSIRNDGANFDGMIHLFFKAETEEEWNGWSWNLHVASGEEVSLQKERIAFDNPDIYRIWVTTETHDMEGLGGMTVVVTPAATLTAKSYTREYGEENPDFGYTADKGGFSGAPDIICEADKYSDVGTYDIVITRGGVDNEFVTYVNGTLTIIKAPLTVTAQSCYMRQEGEMPEFYALYDGFRNGDDEYVLSKQPQFSTSATPYSAMGDYTISVSGAEAKNYTMSYVLGLLTVVGRMGDVNRDTYVNTTDVVDVVQYIFGYPNVQTVYDADLNQDDEVTVTDVSHVVYYVMTNDRAAARLKAPVASLTNSLLSLSQDEQGRLAVSLKNDVPIIGIQFDVLLPEDGDISEVLLSEARKNGHAVAMRQMENGYYRVLAYSMQNNTLMGNEGLLATLLINGVDGEVVLTNIHVTDAQLVDHALPDVSLSMLTGISTLTEATVPFDIYDLNGRLVRRNATSTKGLRRGFYMINNQKVVIK